MSNFIMQSTLDFGINPQYNTSSRKILKEEPPMKELVEAIRQRGKGIGTEIVKVDMFLNLVDTDLFVKMGQAFAGDL